MAKGIINCAHGPGVYGATYSGVPVYEFQFGEDLKEHVMRRRSDDWVNATHILKAAGFDKPARTRILEREVQKDVHEKIQGGYGKYQGTWIPLPVGEALAQRNNVYDKLHPIFEYSAGDQSPPPAPRHASKPKAPRKPAVPKWNYDNGEAAAMHEDDTPDNVTVASVSYMAEEERQDPIAAAAAAGPSAHRKRKREEPPTQSLLESQHYIYGDELLDYFLLSRNEQPAVRPEPPANFQPNWIIDTESHTALHWASAMGDIEVVRQLKRFGASLSVRNQRGETPFMHAVNFTNCFEKQRFPQLMTELFETVDQHDDSGCTVIHHAAATRNRRIMSQSCAVYYLENILTKLEDTHDPALVQKLVDIQDNDGNTALHMAAERNVRKCVRVLIDHRASADIPNNEGIRAEDIIAQLNDSAYRNRRLRSSSPLGHEPHFRDAGPGHADREGKKLVPTFQSPAATMVHSRMMPLIVEKFQEMVRCHDEEWAEKVEAEKEAHRILSKRDAEIAAAKKELAMLESQLEPEDEAARVEAELSLVRQQVLALVTRNNRERLRQSIDQELGQLNGEVPEDDATPEEKIALARQLSRMFADQVQVEADYVDALAMAGTGDKTEKYSRLLRKCLDPSDGESLDGNLDRLIEMMEEERDVVAGGHEDGGEAMGMDG